MKKDFFKTIQLLMKIQQTQIDYVGTSTFFLKALNVPLVDVKAFILKHKFPYREHKNKSVIHIFESPERLKSEYGIPTITIFY